MNLLVTGGEGFIGKNFIQYMIQQYPHYSIRNVDLKSKQDICNYDQMNEAMRGVDMVVHFAAEASVDYSIADPSPFLRTNVLGTNTLLDLALKHTIARFHHISTDEVFGSGGPFNERTPYSPRNPYAASKAASDHLVRAYGETYQLPWTMTYCSNNYGPHQTLDKVIPNFITKALKGEPLPIYGRGLCLRDYLYVEDHCRAIDLVLHSAPNKESYCVATGLELNGVQLASLILELINGSVDQRLLEYVPDRPGHDYRYLLNITKIRKLGWEQKIDFQTGLTQTIDWYKDNLENLVTDPTPSYSEDETKLTDTKVNNPEPKCIYYGCSCGKDDIRLKKGKII